MSTASLVLRTKIRNSANHARLFVRDNPFQSVVGAVIAVVFFVSLYFFFVWMFDLVESQELVGKVLVERLLGMIFLSIFAMLIFSNIIITLSTTYLSAELDFMMSSPMSSSSVFLVKFAESVLYSSWAFLFFSLPMFLAFAEVRDLSWTFYLYAALFIIPFILIPGALGAWLTMLLAAFFPARRTRILIGVLGFLSMVILFVLVKLTGGNELVAAARQMRPDQILSYMRVGTNPFLPSRWMNEGILAAADGNTGQFRHHLLVLTSTALMALQICFWFVPSLYYRGWALAREAEGVKSRWRRFSLAGLMQPLLRPLPRPIQALLRKDVLTFWRDPTQWSQFVLVFGLLAIYFANMKSQQAGLLQSIAFWEHLISYFNLGVTSFVLSILTTRFIYPAPSLEGRQYWIVGMAPIRKTAIVWQKYVLCLSVCLIGSLSLISLSGWLLTVDEALIRKSFITMTLLSLGLSSMAVGLGSAFATFRDDNPARIANSPGGMMNMVLSLLYVLGTLVLLAYPDYIRLRFGMAYDGIRTTEFWSLAGLIVLNATVIIAPLWIGLRRWQRMEVR